MVMFDKADIQSEYRVIDYIFNNFDQKTFNHVHIERYGDNNLSIFMRTHYRMAQLPLDIVFEASKKYPGIIVTIDHFDEGNFFLSSGQYDENGNAEKVVGNHYIIINGAPILDRLYSFDKDFSSKLYFNENINISNVLHIDTYDDEGNPTEECLSHHFGYIYMTKHNKMKTEYIGQRTIQSGESWTDYYGSGLTLKPILNTDGKEAFTKKLIDFASSKEDLDLKEFRAICALRETSAESVLNIADGANPQTRKFIYNKVFSSIEEVEYAKKNGVIRRRITHFFNNLNDYEYGKLIDDLKVYNLNQKS